MHAWEAIGKTLDYIEANLAEEMTIDALAGVATLSPFYFQRLLSRLVNRPVREYIKLRRLARACGALTAGDRRILDVALDCGFGSHETFTRAFKDAYGMTPETYRASPVLLNQFEKPDLLLGYVMAEEGVPLISDGIVLEINRRTLDAPGTFLGQQGDVPIEGQFPQGEATGVDVPGAIWRAFHEVEDRIPMLPGGRIVGVAFAGEAPAGHFTYFVGREVAPGTQLEGFSTWMLPAGPYIVCGFEAESFEELVTVSIDKAMRYATLWVKRHGLQTGYFVPELYYDDREGVSYMEIWLPLV